MFGSTRRGSLFTLLAAGAAVGIFAGSTLAQTGAAPAAKPVTVQPSTSKPAPAQPASPKATPAAPKIGDAAPDFTLKDTEGKEHKLSDLTAAGKIVVLEWFNPECPVSRGFHESSTIMADTAKEFKDKNVVWLAINSGAAGKEGSGVERNAQARTDWKIEYPVLLDEPGTVGRAYGAKTTPHMFIIGADGKLAYKGDIADRSTPPTNYVEQALTQIIAKETVTTPETKSNGCGIKYGPESKNPG
jgi:peroxiredoxin